MDPFRSLLNLTDGGKRHYVIDTDHVTLEEFEAAAVMADVLWGHEGLAEMLAGTWRMVHDPRFLAMERCGIYDQANLFSPGARSIGVQVLKSGDVFSSSGSVDDMTIYAEMLGEGRHFKGIVEAKGWDPKVALTDEQVMQLIEQECPNYKRRDGSWNKAAATLRSLLATGLVSLVTDYAEIAFCTDWINMDTTSVVEPGQRQMIQDEDGFEYEDETPVIAVEVDNLYQALNLRAQVRMTAYKLLKQFPGIKVKQLEELTFTDLESDKVCQILFATKFDKLYTALLPLINVIKGAQARSYEERLALETAALVAESQDFNAKLKSGEIEQIKTEVAEAPDDDPAVFYASLTNNPYYSGLFQGLQKLEVKGNPEAVALIEELVRVKGAGDVWARVSALVLGATEAFIDQTDLQNLKDTHGTDWVEKSPAQSMVLGENVHASTTEVEGVFDGQSSQAFEFVYLNPNPDARGHHTAVVDVHQEAGKLARRTWSIAPEHYRQMKELTSEEHPIETLSWSRLIDHATGRIKFSRVSE